jgi:alkylation response protein AidB-like acyl-CoA dehydrogenase
VSGSLVVRSATTAPFLPLTARAPRIERAQTRLRRRAGVGGSVLLKQQQMRSVCFPTRSVTGNRGPPRALGATHRIGMLRAHASTSPTLTMSVLYDPRAADQPPSPPGDPMTKADELATDLAKTAVERDRRGGTAKRERDLLRDSGLLNLVIPRSLGGWGAAWGTTLSVVRRLSRVDSSLAHLFGFQHLMLATARLFGTEQQWSALFANTVRERWFWGNALNPLDERTALTVRGGSYRIDGVKSFCSGASDSDMLIVSAKKPGEARLTIAAVPSARPGIHIRQDWDNMGQRQTDSGSVEFVDVEVLEAEILRSPGPLGSVFASLRPCIAQLTLANIYLGIAEGALQEAKRFTTEHGRAWFLSGVARPSEDPYVLARYGDMWLEIEAGRLLVENAGALLDRAWARGDDLSAEERGRCALAIAACKVQSTRAGLLVTSGMFDVMGARATSATADLDRYFRNLRTHTLHDPVDYKVRELGAWALDDRLPTPTFYS